MALLAKLRPSGPWRVGPDSGDRLRVGRVLHSDALYSALTQAFIPLGQLDAWLEATAMHAEGAQVRLSSCFPFGPTENGDTLFLPPPATHWPPPDSLRIRWKSANYVPPTAIWQLLSGKPLIEEHWVVDGVSECLLPVIRNVAAASPFRVSIRSRAAVDRLGQGVEPHQTACLEFSKGAGIWIAFSFADKEAEARWSPALKGALKLIADSGLGGERSSGWGRFEQPEFADGELGTLLFGSRYKAPEEVTGHWLLSLFSPAADDRVDWQQGNYRVVARTGRVESSAGWGAPKRANQMIAEGGVLVAPVAPKGAARDVAPAGFAHPVYRAGFALTLPIGKARPPQPKAVVVDKTLLEALSKQPAAIETPALVDLSMAVETPTTTASRPSGSGLAVAAAPLEPGQPSGDAVIKSPATAEPSAVETPTTTETQPSGSGLALSAAPFEPGRPSADAVIKSPAIAEPSAVETPTITEPRPSGSGLAVAAAPLEPGQPSAEAVIESPATAEPSAVEPPTTSEPRPSGSGLAVAAAPLEPGQSSADAVIESSGTAEPIAVEPPTTTQPRPAPAALLPSGQPTADAVIDHVAADVPVPELPATLASVKHTADTIVADLQPITAPPTSIKHEPKKEAE